MEFAIETIGLTKRYGSLTAVNKLNLKVKRNTIHGFLGPNGAGKTTTIKILVGLLRADEGVVKVLGHEICGDMPEVRLKIGYMPELPKFPKHLRGWELLDIYARMYGMTEQERREQIPKLLDMVGLKGREKDFIGKYSKGMQQRLGIAQALLNDPELVILDEPSLGLDPVGMVEVRELVRNIAKEGRTIFLSSHLLFEVEQVCTHVTVIHKGVALASDTLQNIYSMFSGTAVLQVELAEPSDAVVEALKRFPFISNVEQEENKLTIELKTRDDVRPQISQEIIRSGGVIVSMNLKSRTLEEVFMQLVSKSGVEK
ncbi:MAG: ABC transporter ATP-binding protein [Candidatus Nezhaarchaeales archaeon]|nr:MAG: ABC transporter ATP-binding protein [Candidatus Nezhaarchaeota archaeon WYZ-LMO8]